MYLVLQRTLFGCTSGVYCVQCVCVLRDYRYGIEGKGVSRSAADKIIDSISDELLTDSRRLMYGRSYAMLLGALRKHLKKDCVSMGPSERFDYIVSIFSEGSLRRFSDYLDADISIMTVHSAKGLEWDTVFIPGVTRFDWPGVICSRCESAGMCSRSARGCRIVDAKKKPDGVIEKMGTLYVGVTRPQSGICLRFYAAQDK